MTFFPAVVYMFRWRFAGGDRDRNLGDPTAFYTAPEKYTCACPLFVLSIHYEHLLHLSTVPFVGVIFTTLYRIFIPMHADRRS